MGKQDRHIHFDSDKILEFINEYPESKNWPEFPELMNCSQCKNRITSINSLVSNLIKSEFERIDGLYNKLNKNA